MDAEFAYYTYAFIKVDENYHIITDEEYVIASIDGKETTKYTTFTNIGLPITHLVIFVTSILFIVLVLLKRIKKTNIYDIKQTK